MNDTQQAAAPAKADVKPGVVLTYAGYMWQCPGCGHTNGTVVATDSVQCGQCESVYLTRSVQEIQGWPHESAAAVWQSTCAGCGHVWFSWNEPGSEKEPGWCPACDCRDFDAVETVVVLEALLDAAEEVTRCAHMTGPGGVTVYAISDELMSMLKEAVRCFRSTPYHLEGGRKVRDTRRRSDG